MYNHYGTQHENHHHSTNELLSQIVTNLSSEIKYLTGCLQRVCSVLTQQLF